MVVVDAVKVPGGFGAGGCGGEPVEVVVAVVVDRSGSGAVERVGGGLDQ